MDVTFLSMHDEKILLWSYGVQTNVAEQDGCEENY
jgi:hypothetical protein